MKARKLSHEDKSYQQVAAQSASRFFYDKRFLMPRTAVTERANLPERMTNRYVSLACERCDCEDCCVRRCFRQQSLHDADNFIERIRVRQPDVHEIERHSWKDDKEKRKYFFIIQSLWKSMTSSYDIGKLSGTKGIFFTEEALDASLRP